MGTVCGTDVRARSSRSVKEGDDEGYGCVCGCGCACMGAVVVCAHICYSTTETFSDPST